MAIKVLLNRVGYEADLSEMKNSWITSVLSKIEDFNIDEFESLADNSKKLEYFLNKGIEVISYVSIGGVKVFFKNNLIAEWAGPDLILKKDSTGYYFEATIECWSIFDEEG